MCDPIVNVFVCGPQAVATAALLDVRLRELGDCVLCELRVEPVESAPPPAEDILVFPVAVHDSPAFAADKILDALADRDLLDLGAAGLSPEEEEQIRARLQGLGYLD